MVFLSVSICQYVHQTHDLGSTSIPQQRSQIPLLGLQIAVATNVLLPNEDIGHRALSRHLSERILDGRTVIDLIQLNGVVLCAGLAQQRLGRLAVRAVGLGEDGDGVLVDDALGLCLCGGHTCGAGGAGEEAGEEGNGGGWVG